MKFFQLWVALWLVTLEALHSSVSITVTFPIKQPLYVALGRTLVLEAQVKLQAGEKIFLRTWERKNENGEVRVADDKKTINSRTSLEMNGLLLRIQEVVDDDYGTYKFTVTDSTGIQTSVSHQVLKITNPPKASLSLQCIVSTEGAQWDSPVFSWQADGVDITNQTSELSADGRTLLLKKILSQNYTCVTDSSQGTSTVQVRVKAPNPEPKPEPDPSSPSCSCNGWIAFTVIEGIIIIIILIGVYCYYRYKKNTSRGERDVSLRPTTKY